MKAMILPALAFTVAAPVDAQNLSDPQRDRASILAMQGEYTIDFAFDETVILKPGYERHQAQRTGGEEVVIVVQDTPTKIVLQHILVDQKSGHVTKHWRQDWMFEATHRFEFTSDQTWTVHAIPLDKTRGAWTQCVFEVSDAPRYCGTGKWAYDDGIATWTSDATWRPLPRREYTKRSDYNVVGAINRHTLTPNGWTHEQFNTKIQRAPDGTTTPLVREFGFNDYRKVDDMVFAPAYKYWDATQDYWAQVRTRWDRFLVQVPGLHLKTKVDGMAMIVPLFTQAESIGSGKVITDSEIDAVFTQWVESASPETMGTE